MFRSAEAEKPLVPLKWIVFWEISYKSVALAVDSICGNSIERFYFHHEVCNITLVSIFKISRTYRFYEIANFLIIKAANPKKGILQKFRAQDRSTVLC